MYPVGWERIPSALCSEVNIEGKCVPLIKQEIAILSGVSTEETLEFAFWSLEGNKPNVSISELTRSAMGCTSLPPPT